MATTHQEAFVDAPSDANALEVLEKLRAQTTPTSKGAGRPPIYNAPDRWYAREDGHIVKLQADAASQAYYTSKGFHLLTPSEARQWEHEVRPLVIVEQRKRASLITTLRRIANKHPGVDIAGDLDITPTDELEGMLEQLKTMTGGNIAVVQGRFREDEPIVDTSDVSLESGEDLQRKLEESQARAAGARSRGRSAVTFKGNAGTEGSEV